MMLSCLKLLSIPIFFLLINCSTIPPEAPELSAELGKRIAAIESSNITLLKRFFDQKRKEVDVFIEEEWVPEFAEQFISNPTIANAWNTIVREDDKQQRLLFLIKVGPRLQAMITQKRLELIQPLDDLERRMESKIRAQYDEAKAINNSISSFLLSSLKVAESKRRYLELAGISDDRISKLIDQTDEAVASLSDTGGNAQDKAVRVEQFLGQVREIRESIE